MISHNYFWLNIFLLAVGTFAIRFSIIAISSRLTISQRLREIFSYIPAAILPAFIAPAVFFHRGQVDFLNGKERFFILVAATVISFYTRSTLLTIGFGLGALYLVGILL